MQYSRSAARLTRKHARQALSARRLLSAPVVLSSSLADAEGSLNDTEGAFEGFVDVASILRHLLASLPPPLLADGACDDVHGALRTMHALSHGAGAQALRAPVAAVSRADGDLLYSGFAGASLLDVVNAAFVHPYHVRDVAVCHRVAAADIRPELDAATSLRSVDARSMRIVSHMDLIRRVRAF